MVVLQLTKSLFIQIQAKTLSKIPAMLAYTKVAQADSWEKSTPPWKIE